MQDHEDKPITPQLLLAKRILYAYSYGGGDKLIEQIINDYLKKNKDQDYV